MKESQEAMALRLIREYLAVKPNADADRVRRIRAILWYLDQGVLSEVWWHPPDRRGIRQPKTQDERDHIWNTLGRLR